MGARGRGAAAPKSAENGPKRGRGRPRATSPKAIIKLARRITRAGLLRLEEMLQLQDLEHEYFLRGLKLASEIAAREPAEDPDKTKSDDDYRVTWKDADWRAPSG